MPGNNTIELCPAAVCAAVQHHINAGLLTGNLQVKSVEAIRTDGTMVYRFTVTTDPKEKMA